MLPHMTITSGVNGFQHSLTERLWIFWRVVAGPGMFYLISYRVQGSTWKLKATYSRGLEKRINTFYWFIASQLECQVSYLKSAHNFDRLQSARRVPSFATFVFPKWRASGVLLAWRCLVHSGNFSARNSRFLFDHNATSIIRLDNTSSADQFPVVNSKRKRVSSTSQQIAVETGQNHSLGDTFHSMKSLQIVGAFLLTVYCQFGRVDADGSKVLQYDVSQKQLKRRSSDTHLKRRGLLNETLANNVASYYATVEVGTPPQTIYLELSTSDPDIWLLDPKGTCSQTEKECVSTCTWKQVNIYLWCNKLTLNDADSEIKILWMLLQLQMTPERGSTDQIQASTVQEATSQISFVSGTCPWI